MSKLELKSRIEFIGELLEIVGEIAREYPKAMLIVDRYTEELADLHNRLFRLENH